MKLLLNKKYTNKHPYFRNSKKSDLPELLHQYNGFEGECIYFSEINNKFELYENVEKAKKLISDTNLSNYLLILCVDIENSMILSEGFIKKSIHLGYDFGILLDQDELYSSVLHEILFGHVEELRMFKDRLNQNFLFSSLEMVNKYMQKHHQLSLKEKDVEIEDDMKAYEIWEYKD